jgi:hypothetical protein
VLLWINIEAVEGFAAARGLGLSPCGAKVLLRFVLRWDNIGAVDIGFTYRLRNRLERGALWCYRQRPRGGSVTQLEGMGAVSVPRTCNPLVGRHRGSPRAVDQKETMVSLTTCNSRLGWLGEAIVL